MGKLFGTDGIRGIINEDLTPNLILKMGQAIGAYLGEGSRVVIGRDVRSGGDMIFHSITAGLQSQGVKVYFTGYIPTPGLQYYIKNHPEFDAGIMITASHNPAPYNGIKVIDSNGIEIGRDKEKEIEDIFFTERFKPVNWTNMREPVRLIEDAVDEYIEGMLTQLDAELISRKKFKVVVDPANSVGGLVTPKLLRRLGVKVYTINGHLDSSFPGREPEPTVDSLAELSKIVRSMGADLGIGHDGDADRAILVDEKGNIWWGDRSGSLISGYVGEKYSSLPRKVYTGVSSSILVEEYLNPRGIKVIWTPVGSVIISHKIINEGGAIAGFEENGGYMHTPHQIVRDGAMKAGLFLELMAYKNKRASELFNELPKYYPIKTKISMNREKAKAIVQKLKDLYSHKYNKIVTIDGIKVFGDDFWFLIRPSGTEPVLRIMLEAKDIKKAQELLDAIKKDIYRVSGN